MKSERAALNLLRNVYKKKGTTDYGLAGYHQIEDHNYLVFKCERCGEFLDALYTTCPGCGRIYYAHLMSNRVIFRNYKKSKGLEVRDET